MANIHYVAIPSNRVNVSYPKAKGLPILENIMVSSQSPQIGSMFLTLKNGACMLIFAQTLGRNPLKSGQCFLLIFLAL